MALYQCVLQVKWGTISQFGLFCDLTCFVYYSFLPHHVAKL